MRALVWILLGLLAGSVATLSILNALRPATAFPRGVMAVLQHHLGAANEAVSQGRCDAASARHFEALALLAEDVVPAFAPLAGEDEVFARYAAQLVETTRAAQGTTDACRNAAAQLGAIKDACKACHRDYR
ncbi:MAG: hypothetical protein KatS3mg126_1553 [Lysobacteraceae bacterium]|nr:MAG: hypothetical protein KatS3mg126_1553 [Xanthomonadaceae bacterium]